MAPELDPDVAERLERERSFHDDRFTDDASRAAAGRFYELVDAARSTYESAVEAVPVGGSALEYGAGTGGLGPDLADRGVQVTGIDISPVAVDVANASARARGLAPEACRYLEMDAEDLDLPDDSFDLVFGSGILHHLDLDRSLAEIARVLGPDGRAVFFEPMGHNPAINLYRRLTPSMRSPDEHPLLVSDLRDAARWFGDVHVEHHVLLAFAAVPFRRAPFYERLVRRLNRIDSWLLRRIPPLARYGWIAVVELRAPRAAAGS